MLPPRLSAGPGEFPSSPDGSRHRKGRTQKLLPPIFRKETDPGAAAVRERTPRKRREERGAGRGGTQVADGRRTKGALPRSRGSGSAPLLLRHLLTWEDGPLWCRAGGHHLMSFHTLPASFLRTFPLLSTFVLYRDRKMGQWRDASPPESEHA